MTVPPETQELAFDDFEAFDTTIRAWDVETAAFDTRSFFARLFQASAGSATLTSASFSGQLAQRGAPPAGMRTICLGASPESRFHWRGRDVTGSHLLVFPAGAELDVFVSAPLNVITVSVHDDQLATVAEDLGAPDLDTLLRGREVVECDNRSLDKIRTKAQEIEGGTLDRADAIARDLPSLALLALQSDSGEPGVPSRAAVFAEAMSFVASAPDEPWSVGDLAQRCGVTRRTLETAFAERCGMPPKRVLKRLRLHAVRRELARIDPSARVSDVAAAWGFWHLGEFAADYRALFRELPSETLAQARNPGA